VEVSQPKSLFILLHGAIGDVVRALPLAVRIKASWPDTRLVWGVEPLSAGILQGHPAVDEIIIFDRKSGWNGFKRYIAEIKAQQFEMVLDLQRHLKSGLISFLSGARIRIGFHWKDSKEGNFLFSNRRIPKFSEEQSKLLHYQEFGDELGLPRLSAMDAGLKFDSDVTEPALESLRNACLVSEAPLPEKERRVALLIGGSWESKRWNAESFAIVAGRIVTELKALPILFGGPQDENLADEIIGRLNVAEYASVVGKTSLRELAYLLTQVKSAVSMDSGPMHIAAAVGTPVVSLWGPTDPRRAGPIGSEAYQIQSAIGCAPCMLRECPGLNRLCLLSIPPDVVMHRLREIHGRS